MGIQDASYRIDIKMGTKPDRVYFKDYCYESRCYEWDYACLLKCEGPEWEYAPMSLVATDSLLALKSSAPSTFDPYAVQNSDYYSNANNKARYDKCKSLCKNDFDCKFYCSNMRFEDNSIRLDIRMGSKSASNGWQPTTQCGKWRKNYTIYYPSQYWYYSYPKGCYEWDYQCLVTCEGKNWQYAPMSLASIDLSNLDEDWAEIQSEWENARFECVKACDDDSYCTQSCEFAFQQPPQSRAEVAPAQPKAVVAAQTQTGFGGYYSCLTKCFSASTFPVVQNCYGQCEPALSEESSKQLAKISL